MTLSIGFDFDDTAREQVAVAACVGVFACEQSLPDAAGIVVVGESEKCDGYLKRKKAVVYCPPDAAQAHVTVTGRNAPLDRPRLFVVGSEKTPRFLDAMVCAITLAEAAKPPPPPTRRRRSWP